MRSPSYYTKEETGMAANTYNKVTWREWIQQAIKDYEESGQKQKAADGRKVLEDLEYSSKKLNELEDSLFERGVD